MKTIVAKTQRATEQCGRHFIRWAKTRLPKKTGFALHQTAEDTDLPFWYLSVAVPLDSMEWDDVERTVCKLATRYGLTKRFQLSGAGTGFDYRDIGFIQKNR